MDKAEFNNLKKGDVVIHISYVGYYIVEETYEDKDTNISWINCQDIDKIDEKTEFGYIYENWNAEHCTKITNPIILEAINFACNDESVENRTEFIYGVECLLNKTSEVS